MLDMEEENLNEAREKIPYVMQNLRAVYGTPELEKNVDPLDCLIETILSQSTTNVNSQRAFGNLKQRFADWEEARRARVTSIEAAIRCGGLAKQKSVIIKRILNEIKDQCGSLDLSFLRTVPLAEAKEFLSNFKGVGPKTVACVLLFSCNAAVFPVDTHIFRIARRLCLIPEKCGDQEAHEMMEQIIAPERFYEAHINLIRHGRKICRPQKPLCEACVILDYCQYYRTQF
jgi:endonuclease III